MRIVASRLASRSVAIGRVSIGSRHPVAIQSMTNTFTSDAEGSAAQIAELARAGCDIVRLTVPARVDAEALPQIRAILAREGLQIPLVADIHFSPKIAMQVVEQVEKIRINPGNFSDSKTLRGEAYDESRWEQDRDRAREIFVPLVDRARELGVAMRIGVNHGSLSDRLVHRYGDTPEGMVASAVEFLEFAEDRGFRDLVISMKSSIPQVMVQAYRLLTRTLQERGELYPLHLGVTEAGGGDDGRIKSAAGIATLLQEGIGDTIRVSLTEDPVAEIPVARELVRHYVLPVREPVAFDQLAVPAGRARGERRSTAGLDVGAVAYGATEVPRVELVLSEPEPGELHALTALSPPVELIDLKVDGVGDWDAALERLGALQEGTISRAVTVGPEAWKALAADAELRGRVISGVDRVGRIVDPQRDDVAALAALIDPLPLLALLELPQEMDEQVAARFMAFSRTLAGRAKTVSIGLAAEAGADIVSAYRLLAATLDRAGCRAGLVLSLQPTATMDPRLEFAARLAPLLLDGLGISLRLPGGTDPARASDLAHRILQAARRRLERSEFIACPSCGRTLFDLEETTGRIQRLTEHLKLKIAVMGCIVNGPGEMADADYGFVGWGPGKVALFVGSEMVRKNIPHDDAPEQLLALIRERGDWIDPPA